jgi:uncharacterized protein (TIGR00297 family)
VLQCWKKERNQMKEAKVLLQNWGIGLLGSLLVAGAAYQRRSLSASGAIAAAAMGMVMYALGSLAWFGTLLAFFLSSTILSKLNPKKKAAAESGYAKGGRRDAGQVAANGGIGLVLCVMYAIWPEPIWWIVFVGVMATVNADTWATELGGLSKALPRSIISGKKVTPGTSGGITWLGLAASAAGGLFIGGAAYAFAKLGNHQTDSALLIIVGAGLVAGFIGSLLDSWLGATLQVMYRCAHCSKEVEKSVHCDRDALLIRGWPWMTNDAVNAISSIGGGAVAFVLFLLV